jgi:anti-sigma factor RsiW
MTTPHPDGVTLNDYVDDALSPAARAEIGAHIGSCPECQVLAGNLRAVQSAARGLPPLQPRREAWDRIERSLRTTSVGRRSSSWRWLAAAAAVVLATLIGLTVADLRRRSAATPSTASGDAPTAQSVEAELLQAEQHYQKAIAGLEQIANAEKGSLDPQTASTLEKSLTVIDQAISESRAALRAQPSSEPAQASLLESFKSKIALLQDTVTLINEMRKGNKGT